MNKEKLAVIQGVVVALFISGVLTLAWAAFFHFFPNVWSWVKSLAAIINYSFALYIGVLSASLRTKALGINAPLYVLLIFFAINLILRAFFVEESLSFSLVLLKLIYSIALLAVAFKHAQVLQNSYSSTRRYGRLR